MGGAFPLRHRRMEAVWRFTLLPCLRALIAGMIECPARHGASNASWVPYVSPASDRLPGMRREPDEAKRAENPAKPGVSGDTRGDSIDRRLSVAPMMDWTDDL
jgi:hypothetical protein